MKTKVLLKKVKKALVSRYIFDNWFSLLIRYALIKFGFNIKLRAKINNCVVEIDKKKLMNY